MVGPTLRISGSFHGPLSERIHPPSSAHLHLPPKNSGNSLTKKTQWKLRLKDGQRNTRSVKIKNQFQIICQMTKPDTDIFNAFMNSPFVNYFKQLTIVLVAKNLIIYKLI